jgi:hypothetical protein
MNMKKITIIINPNDFKSRTFTTSEIGRGIGIQTPKKGKGSYNRKAKHKRQYNTDNGYTAFCIL